MSLLVDYVSSSEDEVTPSVPAPTVSAPPVSTPVPSSIAARTATSITPNPTSNAPPKPQKLKKKKKKTKTTLHLPPEIQRLLETGTSGAFSDDSDGDNELMAKHKRAKKAASKRPRPSTEEKDSVLSFLPPPKHELPTTVSEETVVSEEKVETQQVQAPVAEAAAVQQNEENAAAWQQYYQQQQLYQANYAAGPDFYVGQGEEDVPGGSSKRRRTRERDIERALQQGHFESVTEQIAEVQGPSPNAWQPPIDELTRSNNAGGSSEQDVKVKASFWNAQAGTKVSSVKPSRLQRQKHQLNQLAFDAKLRDFELLDKRSASLKTKRETYAKYGW